MWPILKKERLYTIYTLYSTYTYKIHIFIDAYNIIIKYDKSYYTYIKFFNKITLKYLLYF